MSTRATTSVGRVWPAPARNTRRGPNSSARRPQVGWAIALVRYRLEIRIFGRIVADGPTTISELAHAEHVLRQSMAETVAALRAHDLITAAQDPDDGRKTLITATGKGRSLLATSPAAGEAWLAAAIGKALGPGEEQALLKAAAIMNRIADADV